MYSILRINKIKSKQQLKLAVAHNMRTMQVKNADEDFQHLNKNFLNQDFDSVEKQKNKLFNQYNIKPRKNAVEVVEVVLTASPEFFAENSVDKWLELNKKFLIKEFGKQNLLQVNLHLDESTPHLHVLFTPITPDGRLSCKDLYGGAFKLRQLQSRYADAMSQLGLSRGLCKSETKAEHTSIKHFYSLVNKIKNLSDEQFEELVQLFEQFEDENQIEHEIMKETKKLIDDEIKSRLILEKIRNKKKPK